MKRMALLCTGMLLLPLAISAGPIYATSGSTNPFTQDGDLGLATSCNGCSPNPSAGAVPLDLGTTPAWNVNASGLGTWTYEQDLSTNQIAQATANGWVLSADLRVLDPAGTAPNQSVFVAYEDGTDRYIMYFGTDASGNPIVDLSGGYNNVTHNLVDVVSQTVEGTGYHLYELEDTNGVLNFLVDNVLVAQGTIDDTFNPGTGISWGADSGVYGGDANYASVQFSTDDPQTEVPEPGGVFLLGPGLFALGVLRRRYSKSTAITS